MLPPIENCNILSMNGHPFRTPLFRWGYNAWNSSQVDLRSTPRIPTLPLALRIAPLLTLSSPLIHMGRSNTFAPRQALPPACIAAETEVQ